MKSLKISLIIATAFIAGAFVASPELRAYASTVANDVVCIGCVGTSDLAGNAVTAAKIKDGEVKAAEIATGAVLSSEIKDNSISAIDMNSRFISGGFIADGQSGWNPGCPEFDRCEGLFQHVITNVPNARDGSVVAITVNDGRYGICAVSDVETERFEVTCSMDPEDGAFLDYIVINRQGIQP